jgi:hypothetical protein
MNSCHHHGKVVGCSMPRLSETLNVIAEICKLATLQFLRQHPGWQDVIAGAGV